MWKAENALSLVVEVTACTGKKMAMRMRMKFVIVLLMRILFSVANQITQRCLVLIWCLWPGASHNYLSYIHHCSVQSSVFAIAI